MLHGAGCFGARPEEQLAEKEQLFRKLQCGGEQGSLGGAPDLSCLSLSQKQLIFTTAHNHAP
eukprot:1160220-Pelagomonas_calceolata.AAC.5